MLVTLHRPTPGILRSRIPVRRVSAPDRAAADLNPNSEPANFGCRLHSPNFAYEELSHIISAGGHNLHSKRLSSRLQTFPLDGAQDEAHGPASGRIRVSEDPRCLNYRP